MAKVWPHATIREIIALASLQGEARATLQTPREAELFRFAIYSFRRSHNVGYDLSVTIGGNDVLLTKNEPKSVIIQPAFALRSS